MWLVHKHCLLTNLERYRSHMADTIECYACSQEEENLPHLLRDCKWAKPVWEELDDNQKSYSWRLKFISSLWWLWQWRNNCIFRCVNKADFLRSSFEEALGAFRSI
ncbi:hypothetical protein V2J09_006707 [Rumex salicifolius]